MKKSMACPECGGQSAGVIARCVCSDMLCDGKKCGAGKVYEYYRCASCGHQSEPTKEYKVYLGKVFV